MTQWTDQFLDTMRVKGDLAADTAVTALYNSADHQVMTVVHEMARNDDKPTGLPPEVENYFLAESEINMSEEDKEMSNVATRLFNRYGFRLAGLLYFKSLPEGYQCWRPSHVLGTTKLLTEFPARRVVETSQFVFDVMRPDWYEPTGRGITAILKVRLMHAGMRHMILNDSTKNWDTNTLGIPINQEDLILTLQLFSLAGIDGLDRMGIKLHLDEKQAYFHHWMKVGQVLGIDERLRLISLEDSWNLHQTIKKRGRNYPLPTQDGPELTEALLGVVSENTDNIMSLETLEKITLYFIGDRDAYKYLGMAKPSLFDSMIDTIVYWLVNWKIFDVFHYDATKDEKPGLLAKMMRHVLIKRFGITDAQSGQLKTDIMEHITKLILGHMHQDDIEEIEEGEDPLEPLTSTGNSREDAPPKNKRRRKDHKSIQIHEDLIAQWQLGGFNFGDIEKT